jgi:hypothetical protein
MFSGARYWTPAEAAMIYGGFADPDHGPDEDDIRAVHHYPELREEFDRLLKLAEREGRQSPAEWHQWAIRCGLAVDGDLREALTGQPQTLEAANRIDALSRASAKPWTNAQALSWLEQEYPAITSDRLRKSIVQVALGARNQGG